MNFEEIKKLEMILYNSHLKIIFEIIKILNNNLKKKFECDVSNNLFFIRKYFFKEISNSDIKIIITYNLDFNEWILKNEYNDKTIIEIFKSNIIYDIIKFINNKKSIKDKEIDDIDALCLGIEMITLNKKVIKKIIKK